MKVINGLVLEEDKVLVVKKFVNGKGVYILPGGKIDHDESIEDCLKRKFSEDLNGTKINIIDYKSLIGINPKSQENFEVDVYVCELNGKLNRPSGEIWNRRYVSFDELGDYNFSPVTSEILGLLVFGGIVR